MSAEERPTMPEAAAVFAAVKAYRETLGLAPGNVEDLRVYLEELKTSIAKLEAVTLE